MESEDCDITPENIPLDIIYEDKDIECFFVGNPRADGHMCISSINHYHDLSEAPDYVNEKIIR